MLLVEADAMPPTTTALGPWEGSYATKTADA
jgi:hypothetical protein